MNKFNQTYSIDFEFPETNDYLVLTEYLIDHWADFKKANNRLLNNDCFRDQLADAYKVMTKCMPDNGVQVIMFAHKKNYAWFDLLFAILQADLMITKIWYVICETNSGLKTGDYLTGIANIVLRKNTFNQLGKKKCSRKKLLHAIKKYVLIYKNDFCCFNRLSVCDKKLPLIFAIIHAVSRCDYIDDNSIKQPYQFDQLIDSLEIITVTDFF